MGGYRAGEVTGLVSRGCFHNLLIHGLTRWVSSQQNNDDTVSHSLACSVYRLACHGDVHAHCDFSSARLSVSLPRTVISAALLLRFRNGRACFETSSAASKAMAGASAFCAAHIAWSAQRALVTCVCAVVIARILDTPYSTPLVAEDVDFIGMGYWDHCVLVAAADHSSGNRVRVASMSDASNFARDTTWVSPYGTTWYYLPGKSFGFSADESLDLRPADMATDTLPEFRLSWHLDAGVGGFRAGDALFLNTYVCVNVPRPCLALTTPLAFRVTFCAWWYWVVPTAIQPPTDSCTWPE